MIISICSFCHYFCICLVVYTWALNMTQRRLKKELGDIQDDPPTDCSVVVVGGDIFKWEATMIGAKGTPYESGVYLLEIVFPQDYPFKAPKVKFGTKILHFRVNDKGGICLPVLKDNWSPALTIKRILIALRDNIFITSGGIPGDVLVPNVRKLMVSNMIKFCKTAIEWNVKYAGGSNGICGSRLNERGSTKTECNQFRKIVDFWIEIYVVNNSQFDEILSRIINEYCDEAYYPFPKYEPWINFCENEARAKSV